MKPTASTSKGRSCLIRTTTALLLEALATLWDIYDEADHKPNAIAVVEIASWK